MLLKAKMPSSVIDDIMAIYCGEVKDQTTYTSFKFSKTESLAGHVHYNKQAVVLAFR